MEERACGNCGTLMAGEFCHACGQRRVEKVELLRMMREGIRRFLDLDTGVLHTMKDLSSRPGAVSREYLAGTRKIYVNPLKYCFVVVTIFALAINFLNVSTSTAIGLEFDQEEQQIFRIVYGVMPYLIFVMLLPVCWVQKRLFRSSGYTLAETYVFSLFTVGHMTWLSVLLAVAGSLETPTGVTILFVAQLAYLVWAMTGFYQLTRPPLLRGILVIVLSALCTNLLALALGNLIALLGLVEPLAESIT
jgi:hypothetical protein